MVFKLQNSRSTILFTDILSLWPIPSAFPVAIGIFFNNTFMYLHRRTGQENLGGRRSVARLAATPQVL